MLQKVPVTHRIGQRFGKLKILAIAETRGAAHIMECRCKCGRTCRKWLSLLLQGKGLACRECLGIGGVVRKACEICGKKFDSYASAGQQTCSKKCTCKLIGRNVRRHGESKTRLHTIWLDMRSRCRLESDPNYRYYGGRGIRVCDAWDRSYVAFRDWALANGYANTLKLDRRRVNGNYEPGNCRWATHAQQMQNTRKRKDAKTSRFKGVSRHSQNKNTWVSQIHGGGKPKYVGSFRSELLAAFAYDDAATAAYGEFAYVNFPERIRAWQANATTRKEGALR